MTRPHRFPSAVVTGCALLLGLRVSTVSADVPVLHPLSPHVRVNTYTTGVQAGVAGVRLAVGPSGEFVVVWGSGVSGSLGTQDGNGIGVFARRFSGASAPLDASEFRVNTYTTHNQTYPRVGADAAGNFVVVWLSRYQGIGGDAVIGKRFSSTGAPLGGEFPVNDFPATGLDLAVDSGGGFLVVWRGTGSQVVGQLFGASGAPVGGNFQISGGAPKTHFPTGAASLGAAGFVVVWYATGDGDGYGVYARRVSASGVPVGGEVVVNTSTTGNQQEAAVASNGATGFVVTWQGNSPLDALVGVFARRFDLSANALGGEFHVNTVTTHFQTYPSVAWNEAGFVVSWISSFSSYPGEVLAQRYGSAGVPIGGEFRMNVLTPGNQFRQSIAAAPAGRFVSAWVDSNAGDSWDLLAVRVVSCVPGDTNGDSAVNVSDVLYFINFLFAGGPPPVGCADVNLDNAINVVDILYLINFGFAGGPAPI